MDVEQPSHDTRMVEGTSHSYQFLNISSLLCRPRTAEIDQLCISSTSRHLLPRYYVDRTSPGVGSIR
jgi:hypothetical protein